MTIGIQNTINAQTRRRRPQAQPQPGECYAYQVEIPGDMVDQVQRYLEEHKGLSFDDVISQSLTAWFAATPPTMGG